MTDSLVAGGSTRIAGLRERKREQNRVTTAEAAWRLFIERGYDNVTVTDICTAADIAPRTFHRYFTGKEDVLAEPVRRMARVVADDIAAADSGADDAEVMEHAMLELGRFVVANRDWITALRVVVGRSQQVRATSIALRPDQEREVAASLVGRHDGTRHDPDWRSRLLVAVAVAAFRVWLDDYFRETLDDPIGHLAEILRAAPSA